MSIVLTLNKEQSDFTLMSLKMVLDIYEQVKEDEEVVDTYRVLTEVRELLESAVINNMYKLPDHK